MFSEDLTSDLIRLSEAVFRATNIRFTPKAEILTLGPTEKERIYYIASCILWGKRLDYLQQTF